VFERYQAWQREVEAQPVAFIGRRLPELLRHARARLATYVGTGTDDLVYVPNATTAVNIIARSLRLAPGAEVLATDHEYGACDRAWRFLCARRGVTYRRVPIEVPVTSAAAVAAQVWAAMAEQTRVLFISHVTSPTALVLPVADLCERARRAGVLTVVDGAHGPGQLDLDLGTLGADFYFGNCHKWLCAPKGAAFLYARPELQGLLEPLIVGWGWEPEKPGPSRFIDEQEFTGTHDYAAYLSVPAAIDFQAEWDWASVRRSCHELLREARRQLLRSPCVSALSPDEPGWYAQMAALELPPADPEALRERLYDAHRVEVPVYAFNGRTLLRVSIQGYNTVEDVESLLAAVRAVLPQGRG
jgi:isopenicillin-N epimerase